MEFEYIDHHDYPYRLFPVRIGLRQYHMHSELEIVLVVKGSIDIYLDTQKYHLKAGDLFIVAPLQAHRFMSTSEANLLLVFQFDSQSLALGDDRLFFTSPIVKNNRTVLIKQLNQLYKLQSSNDLASQLIKKSLSVGFTGQLLKNHPYKLINNSALNKDLQNQSFLEIINYINLHYRSRLTLKELSDLFHLSTFYLSHLIKKNLGMSFQEYINSKRLVDATKEILLTDKKVLQIAMDCGFSDIKYLNALCKSYYSCTALQLRKQPELKRLYQSFPTTDTIHLPFDESLVNDHLFLLIQTQEND